MRARPGRSQVAEADEQGDQSRRKTLVHLVALRLDRAGDFGAQLGAHQLQFILGLRAQVFGQALQVERQIGLGGMLVLGVIVGGQFIPLHAVVQADAQTDAENEKTQHRRTAALSR